MEFETQAQQEVYEKIEPWMKEMFGIFLKKREDAPYFGVHVGSAFVHVGVHPWEKNNATLTTRAYVAVNVEITPELMEFLLRENDTMRFGAFGLDKDHDIFFEHTIVGTTCDIEDVKSSVLAVGYAVDQYDDQIVARWGGMRASDVDNES
jgi:hypothetical protein